eukprot:15485065-Alexandrium_andersonii.AAC.1
MSKHGSKTKKPTIVYPNKAAVREPASGTETARPKKAPKLAHAWTSSEGRKRCAGDRLLKNSQSYPPGFGQAMLRLMQADRG